MNWKLKSTIQNVVSRLPSRLSYDVYYLLQRHFGNLKISNPASRLQAGAEIIRRIQQAGCPVLGKTFLEVGTGHQLNIPIALWLCGAGQTITIDHNPYLKPQLIQEDITYLRKHSEEIRTLFQDQAQQPLYGYRHSELLKQQEFVLDEFLRMMNIQYCSHADAAHLHLDSESIDFHISYTTLEHIPPEPLIGVLLESRRVLRRDGLFVHLIDMTDHFSHSDRSISSINFLQFSDSEWQKYAGNRYMYQNRMRIDEYLKLIKAAGLTVVSMETRIDPVALNRLRQGQHLNDKFRDKPPEVNAISSAWIIARPAST
jgi:SAM-dependent methyltransferase